MARGQNQAKIERVPVALLRFGEASGTRQQVPLPLERARQKVLPRGVAVIGIPVFRDAQTWGQRLRKGVAPRRPIRSRRHEHTVILRAVPSRRNLSESELPLRVNSIWENRKYWTLEVWWELSVGSVQEVGV